MYTFEKQQCSQWSNVFNSVTAGFFRFQWRRNSQNYQKTPGHDDISIRIKKICDKSYLKPLILLFQNSTKLSHYPDIILLPGYMETV